MATSSSTSPRASGASQKDLLMSISEYMKCSICMDMLVEPVTSVCGHTFCKECMSHHLNSNWTCPLCKSNVSTCPAVNIVLKELLEEYHQTSGMSSKDQTPDVVTCDMCCNNGRRKAIKSCLICLMSYCDYHLKGHQGKSRLKGHNLVAPVKDLDQRACLAHGRPLELYCTEQGKCICSLCVEDGTDVLPVEKESVIRKKIIADVIKDMEQKMQRREEKVEEFQHSTGKCMKLTDEEDPIVFLQNAHTVPALESGKDWTDITMDTHLTFGTMRNIVVVMKTGIDAALDKLSSIETERIKKHSVDVTLDLDTSHAQLLVSDDLKEVQDFGERRDIPDRSGRFDVFASILGRDQLTVDKAFWVVDVCGKQGWDIGVANEKANRKGNLSLKPSQGYWAIVHYNGDQYAALEESPFLLSLPDKPQKVGVFVDQQEGLVSFYDMGAKIHIYSFTDCVFKDKLLPYFSPHLMQGEKNLSPLRICPVNLVD
ncbi:E3 ubiquitin-protein ligase TRIM39-like isoform X2 [Brachyhypopomus gauderio]|uniref:E3 ubiquitin-protein ligase TRIM39-like isoform X2 n=1 Tax=Brachyhypopomus gauderio TaxID=698409 RepID=UPI0040433255